MRKKRTAVCLLASVLLCAWTGMGCGGQDGVFYAAQRNTDEASETDTGVESGSDLSAQERKALSASGSENGAGSGSGGNPGNGAGSGNEGNPGSSAGSGNGAETGMNHSSETAPQQCYIHICGAVRYPGVYEVAEGSRLYEVIVLAGGLCADACDYLVNQAQIVTDGMQVYIPSVTEVQLLDDGTQISGPAVREAQGGNAGLISYPDTASRTETERESTDTRIDLNRATKEQLMTLPGVGETRAQAIIAYREAHGGFAAVEELMEVSGIKQGVYDRLKEMIKV